MKSLRLVAGRVVTAGDPPFDTLFTIEMADALMNDDPDRAISIMTDLSPRAAAQLMTMIRLDQDLKKRYDVLIAHSKASRTTKKRPPGQLFTIDDVLDEVFVFSPPIASLLFLTDGRRLVREDPDDMTQILTFEQYEKKYGETVAVALERIHAQKNAILERAMHLASLTPQKFQVSFATNDGAYSKRITASDQDQIAAYASRNNTTILSIEEQEQPT